MHQASVSLLLGHPAALHDSHVDRSGCRTYSSPHDDDDDDHDDDHDDDDDDHDDDILFIVIMMLMMTYA